MDYEEPASKFSSLDKVRINLRGTQHVVALEGPCESLRYFSENATWQYVDFGIKPARAIVLYECQPSSVIFDSGRGGRAARLCYGTYLVLTGERTIALPEYHLEKIGAARNWRGIKRIMASFSKLSKCFKIAP